MLKLIGFDGDDTLWHSEGYYREAAARFVDIVGRYVDVTDTHVQASMLATEQRNLKLFGYGAKGMTLSMVETAIAITEGAISAKDIHRLVETGKNILQHPVELLPGVREAVAAVAEHHGVVLITKGDLFHQEKKVAQSGMADLFHRIEIVSEKDVATYRRVLDEFSLQPSQFAMVGNSLRSDIEPVSASVAGACTCRTTSRGNTNWRTASTRWTHRACSPSMRRRPSPRPWRSWPNARRPEHACAATDPVSVLRRAHRDPGRCIRGRSAIHRGLPGVLSADQRAGMDRRGRGRACQCGGRGRSVSV
jgi:putative hydrolase of the HAD superfamily